MSHCRNDSGSPFDAGGLPGWCGLPAAAIGVSWLCTAETAPTTSTPAVARSAVANDGLDERASTAPTFT